MNFVPHSEGKIESLKNAMFKRKTINSSDTVRERLKRVRKVLISGSQKKNEGKREGCGEGGGEGAQKALQVLQDLEVLCLFSL